MSSVVREPPRHTPALDIRSAPLLRAPDDDLALLAGLGVGRRVVLLAVHHIHADGHIYTGGAEKYILTALRALLASGARVHVGYSGTSIYHDLLESASPRRLTVERTNWIDEALSGDARLHWKTILARRRWLRACRADSAFFIQQAGGGAFGASIVAAKSLGLRTVVCVRQLPQPIPHAEPTARPGWIPSPQLWRRRLLWRRRIPAWASDAILFNSQRVADEYAGAYSWPAGRFHVIPNGEWPRDGAAVAGASAPSGTANIDRIKERTGAPRGYIREMATVGRVTHAKGADTVLDAFALVAAEDPRVRLTYFGDGPLIPELRQKAERLGLAHRVRFAGYQADHESIYGGVDLYLQLSRRESMSNSVLEAMARGIPCIVSDVGGLPETVVDGQTGFVVTPDDPAAAARAMRRLIEDPSMAARMGAAGAARVRERFDIRRVMLETVKTVLG